MDNISFYAHHSAFGAFASFMLGKVGKGGGFVLSDVRPPENNLYIGYKQDGRVNLLPFYKDNRKTAVTEFTGEAGKKSEEDNINIFTENEIKRDMSWSSDTFEAGNFKFSLITPFGEVKELSLMSDDEKKFSFAPVIFAQITLDNRNKSTDAEMIFGIEGLKRILSETTEGKYLGGALERKCGFAIASQEGVRELSTLHILSSLVSGNYQNHGLGRTPSLLFSVPAGSVRSFTFALATYQDGKITAGVDTSFYYTEVFKSLEEVLEYALVKADRYIELARKRDRELKESGLNEYKQFIIAHAAHSYHASSQLMKKEDGSPLWIVNEGQYVMINTFDLTVDHVFWELRFHPWTITNVLDLFVDRYSYIDQAGLSFAHDMGVANAFSPKGYSSYELPNLKGCFSYMTHEELLNWVITAAVYVLKTGDKVWTNINMVAFKKCFDSIANRDLNNDGIMDVDTLRCEEGSEITTYDSLDVSLGQARNNLYLGVKSWAAYILLRCIFEKSGDNLCADMAFDKAKQAAATIVSKFDEKNGYIPAVFEEGNTARIIPAVEALIYPYFTGYKHMIAEDGPFGDLITVLKKHINTVLKPGICIDEVSGGWKLSSTSKNTWNSKIFLCQYVIKEILEFDFKENEIEWDKVHASWQQIGCSNDAATDQVNSDTGSARGSKLYPRLVTSILWMK